MKPALIALLLIVFPAIACGLSLAGGESHIHHQRLKTLKVVSTYAVAEGAPGAPPPGVKVPAQRFGPFDPRDYHGRGKRNVFAVVGVLLFAVFLCWYKGEKAGSEKDPDGMRRSHKSVEEDTYGFALASLIRDMQQIANGDVSVGLRSTRIAFALGLLFFTTFLQCFLMYYLKILVIAKWVTDIREDYSQYQDHMYGETFININGKHRGLDGHFMPGNFDSLDDGLKERTCNIAFSQTGFFGAVLLIWTLTVIAELRNIIALFRSLILNTRNIQDMKDSLSDLDPDIPDDDPENAWVIDGLTLPIKLLILFSVILPRLILTSILLWLGCRFLAATNDFGSMVLNAVALEFILCLKDLLYGTIVPDRNKREIAHINIRPSTMIDHASFWSFLGTFTWLLVAFAWIIFYVFQLQAVLPLYKWDVRGPCTEYLKVRYYDGPTTNPPTPAR